MLGAAAIIVKEALPFNYSTPFLVLLAAALGASGVGLTRRSLVTQVVSRGAAWIMLLPATLVTAFSLADGQAPPVEVAALGITTGAALLLARPMLHTREALEQFAPKVFRRWLLAGSTATAATGFVAGGCALTSFAVDGPSGPALGFAALAAALFASAIAVVRMRSWGIFLGALTSAALLVSGLFVNKEAAILMSLAAMPALLLHLLPVLVARATSGDDTSRVRVNGELNGEPMAPVRFRVAEEESARLIDVEPEGVGAERAVLRA